MSCTVAIKTITRAKGQEIVLRSDPAAEQYGAKFKFWVKGKENFAASPRT